VRIADALENLRAKTAARPALALGPRTVRSTATLGDGLRCVSTEKSWEIACDLPPAFGGERAAPTPSQLVQAALGACLAMGYQLRAAERDIELTSVTVTVESDSELGAFLSPRPASPGFTGLRYHVAIESPAEPDAVAALVDAADRLSPVLADLTRPLTIGRTVSISSPTGPEGR
jgi:uncharacterized OsmC-like protein